ncbi:MAG TPA: hypothetical protein VEO73_10055 [Gemmatimonadales bacterium]|nr:hypothetical protein [Gemmatimonadales bacterium]
MKRLPLVAALTVMLGCTDQGVRLPSISVVNNSHGSIIYLAVERETANRLDIIDSVRVASSLDRLVAAGESKVIDIMGYRPGNDIRLFVYRLATPNGMTARYNGFVDVAAWRLRQLGYRVFVTD